MLLSWDNEQRVIEKIRLLFFIVKERIYAIIKRINKSKFIETSYENFL